MPYIATEATTVGEVIEYCAQTLLDGLYAPSIIETRKGAIDRNAAARHAILQLADMLDEVYCADRNTRLATIELPRDVR